MSDLEQKVQQLEELNRIHARQIDALRQVIDTLLLVNSNLVAFADSNCTVHVPPWIRESQQSIQDAKDMLRNLDKIEGMGL